MKTSAVLAMLICASHFLGMATGHIPSDLNPLEAWMCVTAWVVMAAIMAFCTKVEIKFINSTSGEGSHDEDKA